MRAHEQRADQAGDRDGNRPKAPLTTPALQLLALQRAAGNAAVARAVAEERHEHDAHCGHGSAARDPAVQRSAVHEVLRSPGRPLDGPLRNEMEARFGGDDFSGVRVHTDAVARRSAAEIGAKAYASGSHVVWDGQDKHTLAHELDHYRQQGQGPVPGTDNGSGLKVSDPSDWAERQAEETARRVMSGAPPVQRARAAAEDRGGGGRAAEADGHAPVQRALDTEMIDSTREALGITGTVKIVEVPEDVRADTPFAAYPAGHCVGLPPPGRSVERLRAERRRSGAARRRGGQDRRRRRVLPPSTASSSRTAIRPPASPSRRPSSTNWATSSSTRPGSTSTCPAAGGRWSSTTTCW